MKKLITYLKTLWSRIADSQSSDVRHDCRLTVGSPSGFNSKLMLKLVSVLVLILTVGVGNVWGAEGDIAYTLDFTAKTASNNSYTNTWTYGDFSLYAGSNNSQNWAYVRFGGKGGSNTSSTKTINSTITSTTVIASTKTIKQITIEHTKVTSGNYTANKCTLQVASNSDFSSIIDTRIIDNPVKNGTSFNFTPNEVTVWPASSYYKITIGATIKGTSNIGVEIAKVKFVEGASGGGCSDPATALSVSAASTTIYAGVKSQLSTSGGNGSTVTYTVISANSTYATIDGDNKFSATRPGTYRVQASQDASGGTCGGTSTVDITVRYQIKWSVNGDDTYDTGSPTTYIEEYNGKIGTFPTSPAKSACDGSKEFVGWTATPIVGTTNTKPTFVTPQTQITDNTTLYAVFATRTANSYSPGDINDLINGKNVIIYNANQSRAMASSIQATGKLNALAVTFSSTNISSPDAALIWTVYNSGTKYIFKSGNNYLRVTSNSANTKLTCDGTSDTWTITEASTGVYSLYSTAGSSTYPLEAYYSSPNYFFTSYKGSGANWNMKFYVPTYSAYQTACSSDPVLNVTPTSLDFGNVANGTYKELTFSLTGSYLTANASIGVSGTNSSYFSVTPSSVAKGTGTIAATDITVRYTPGAVGDGHTATVTVSSTGADNKTVTLTGNCKASYTVTCSPASNGSVLADKTSNVMSGETVTLTITPSSGYQLSSISAVDGSSNPVSLTGTGNNRTFTMPASNVTVTATFVVRTDYVLVTNVSELNDGDVITIANMKGNNAEGKILHSQADNNRNTKAVTTAADGKIADSDVEYPITLVSDASGWKLYDQENAGYLYAVKGSNYLKNSATPTPTYNDVWTIEIVQTAGDYQYQAWIHQTPCNGGGCGQESSKDRYIEFNGSVISGYLYTMTDGYIYKKELSCEKLAAPTGLTASSITQTTVTLSWNSVTNASGYEISLNNGSSWTSTSTNTSYNATGLTAGTTYNWKVRATGTGDYCDKGNAASSTVTMKNAVKVTYKTNGATGGQLPVAGGVVNLTEGDPHTILGNTGSGGSPTPLTKTGYVFDGWHSSSTYSSTPAYTIGSSITVNSNVDIYANWKPKKDTFVDAVHNTATQYGEGYNYTIPSCSDQTRNTSGTCEETHYKFIGWALAGADLTNPSNIIHAGDTQTASGTDASPKTYYAVWAEEL